MIIPTSTHDGEDQGEALPPSYQEAVPSSQLLPSELPTNSPYAPSLTSRSDPPRERERAPSSVDEKLPVGFPEPHISDGRTNSDPLFPSSKEKERERETGSPTQRSFGMFSSMVWGATPTASTSRSPNSASTSHISTAGYNPLNPTPSAFARPTPKNYAYLPFQPMTMLSISSNLADGFPMLPPPINPEGEGSAGRANPQHPFVSHDVTEEDWLRFLADLKIVASNTNQTQKSFLARVFSSEPSARDRRKHAVHFTDSWNHYFFQPRRMSVILARGRRIFGGASVHHHSHHHSHSHGHHRRHSIGHGRGRDIDPAQPKGQRHRSRSTDSSSSDSSISSSSSSSIHSTVSEPPEMPIPRTHEPSSEKPLNPFDGGSSEKPESRSVTGGDHWTGYGPRRGFGGPGTWRGMGRGYGGWPDRGWHHPGFHGGRGGPGFYPRGRGGWDAPGTAGPSTVPPDAGIDRGLEGKEHGHVKGKSPAYREQKRAWKAEKRGMKHERRRIKREIRHERRQRKWEARAIRHASGTSRKDEPWKLIISFHGARKETGQS